MASTPLLISFLTAGKDLLYPKAQGPSLPLEQLLDPSNKEMVLSLANKRKPDKAILYARVVKALWELRDNFPNPDFPEEVPPVPRRLPPPPPFPLSPPSALVPAPCAIVPAPLHPFGNPRVPTWVSTDPNPADAPSRLKPRRVTICSPRAPPPPLPTCSLVDRWSQSFSTVCQLGHWCWVQLPVTFQYLFSGLLMVFICAPHLLVHLSSAWIRSLCSSWANEVSEAATLTLVTPIKSTAHALNIPCSDQDARGYAQVLVPSFISFLMARFFARPTHP